MSENENLKLFIINFSNANNLNLTVEDFTSAKELLNREKFDFYFLDYLMPEMNGKELAIALKNKFGNGVNVCYLTSYESAAVDILNSDIRPLAFIRKPISETELESVFEKLRKKSFFSSIVLKKDGVSYIIAVKDIIFAEALSKGTVIHCFDKTYEFRNKFNEIVDSYIPETGFYKVHRSFVINLSHVASFSKKEVVMKNGDVIPISRKIDFQSVMNRYAFNEEL